MASYTLSHSVFLSFCSISFPDNIVQPGSFPKSQEKTFETDFTRWLQVTKPQEQVEFRRFLTVCKYPAKR